ncbi:hypothetical protein KKA13_03670 [Patescibacteria group bacterium]|nr:hypothetical protein [Patescibacteria group bacterium]
MYEDAQEIIDYLPIRRDTPENDYINHLWQSFSVLDGSESVARPFAVMPFHLLFMLAIQYKVLRIYKEQKEKYELALTTKNPRDEEKDILAPESPLAIAFLGESEIVDFLKIAGLSADDARSIKKSIVRYRNDKIAHAKGYIEQDMENKIEEYFGWLETLQTVYRPMNQNVADVWLAEIQVGDDMEQFLETHFLDSCFSPRDFGDIIGILLEAEQRDFDQWTQVVNKGLELAYDQTISALHEIAKIETDDGKRFNTIRVLHENGEIDEEAKKSIIESEKDEEILELLKN